jgi:hypothetical protein
MHRKIDPSLELRQIDFLGEEPLATDFREWAILCRIARCADDLECNGFLRKPMRGAQGGLRHVRLRQGQWRAARADGEKRRIGVQAGILAVRAIFFRRFVVSTALACCLR